MLLQSKSEGLEDNVESVFEDFLNLIVQRSLTGLPKDETLESLLKQKAGRNSLKNYMRVVKVKGEFKLLLFKKGIPFLVQCFKHAGIIYNKRSLEFSILSDTKYLEKREYRVHKDGKSSKRGFLFNLEKYFNET